MGGSKRILDIGRSWSTASAVFKNNSTARNSTPMQYQWVRFGKCDAIKSGKLEWGNTEIKDTHALCLFVEAVTSILGIITRVMANILSAWSQIFEHAHYLTCWENGSLNWCTVSALSSLNQQSWPGKSKRFPVLLLFCVKGIFIKLDPWAAASCTNALQWHRFSTQVYNFFRLYFFPRWNSQNCLKYAILPSLFLMEGQYWVQLMLLL